MSMQAPIVSEYSLSKLILIDEAWNVLPVSHSAGHFIRHVAKRLGNQTPVAITAMPADYKHAIADAVFQNTTVQSVRMLTREHV